MRSEDVRIIMTSSEMQRKTYAILDPSAKHKLDSNPQIRDSRLKFRDQMLLSHAGLGAYLI